jgi:protein-S-isoprenylcysteine O-methyltransferase Ste14
MPTIFSGLHWYIGSLGVLVALTGIWEFQKAKTTIGPTKPEKASYLVSGGVYCMSRHPMYLSMQLIIIAVIFKFDN